MICLGIRNRRKGFQGGQNRGAAYTQLKIQLLIVVVVSGMEYTYNNQMYG
jgi:hypothetical protein